LLAQPLIVKAQAQQRPANSHLDLSVPAVPALTPTLTPVCSPSWAVAASPNPSGSLQYLFGIAAVSPTDIWAVGVYDPTPSSSWTLILHWDGNQWSQISSPN